MSGEIHFDIQSLHVAYAKGTKPSEMIETILQRITASNDPGIFIHLASRQELMSEVEKLGVFDPLAKPLWGIPFAVKDNIDVAGMPTTAA
ncbi:MAG: amidase family protein, partial [Aestuariivirga sp.]